MVVPEPAPLEAEFVAAGAVVHVLPMRHISTRNSLAGWLGYALAWPVTVWRLRRLLRRVRADLVHTNSLHSWYGWAAAALSRRPHVWHAREIVVQSKAALRVERFLCRHFAALVIAASHAVAAQLDPDNVVVLEDAPDAAAWQPTNAGRFRSEFGIADDAFTVGVVARLDPRKGIDVALDAFARLPDPRRDARFVIVGDPIPGQEAYAARLTERVAEDPGVRWCTDWRDVPGAIADLDVLVLASVEPEAYGLVLVEALASGVPVVTTDIGGAPEIVAHVDRGAARLVPPRDANSLARAIDELRPASTSTDHRRARPVLLHPVAPSYATVLRAQLERARPGGPGTP